MTVDDPRNAEAADVWKGAHLAGRITRTGAGTSFRYDPGYLAAGLPAVAHTLPAVAGEVTATGGAVPPFFAGLLPEGARLVALTARLKTSVDDMVSLLIAVGADCVGDVRVLAAGVRPGPVQATGQPAGWESMDFAALFGASISSGPDSSERVALPGVQEKVSGAVISFPVPNSAGHLLKLTPSRYPRLVENEDFFLRMARACGLRVADAELVRDRNGITGLLVRRFDRTAGPGGDLVRVPQEDACQLAGRYPADRYRLRTLDVARAVAAVSDAPEVTGRDLVRLVAFSYLIGNGDLHAKNVSVGAPAGGPLDGYATLTPAYDLLSTLPYVPDDPLALEIEGRRNRLRRADLVSFGRRVGVPERAVVSALDRMLDVGPAWAEQVGEIGLPDRLAERVSCAMRARRDLLAG